MQQPPVVDGPWHCKSAQRFYQCVNELEHHIPETYPGKVSLREVLDREVSAAYLTAPEAMIRRWNYVESILATLPSEPWSEEMKRILKEATDKL